MPSCCRVCVPDLWRCWGAGCLGEGQGRWKKDAEAARLEAMLCRHALPDVYPRGRLGLLAP